MTQHILATAINREAERLLAAEDAHGEEHLADRLRGRLMPRASNDFAF